jgi:hypothetical protein
MDTAKKMISAIENSPVRIQKVLESMNDEIKEAETLNNFFDSGSSRVYQQGEKSTSGRSTKLNNVTLLKDPIPIPTNGRKRTARIRSSTEKKFGLRRRRMVSRESKDNGKTPLKGAIVELHEPLARIRSSKEGDRKRTIDEVT